MTEPREDDLTDPGLQDPGTDLPPQETGNDDQEDADEPGDEDEPAAPDRPLVTPGRVVGSYMGRIVLRDPNDSDWSRVGPIVPKPPTVAALEQLIDAALTAAGYAVTVDLTRTDD